MVYCYAAVLIGYVTGLANSSFRLMSVAG